MTKDTEALREALAAHYPTGEWMQPCGNHVLCCSCGENLWGVDRDACKAAWRTHVIEALSAPASAELGFDPTAEVGDEVFPHDTIGSHFGNGGGLDPAEGGVGALHEKIARLIAKGNDSDPWWWKRTFDDLADATAARLREDDLSVADTILTALAHPPHPAPVDPVAGGGGLSVDDTAKIIAKYIYGPNRAHVYWGNPPCRGAATEILAALKGSAA